MGVLDIFQTTVKSNTVTVSDTSGAGDGDGDGPPEGGGIDTAPSFVTRESFFSFTGASAAVAAITLAVSRAGYDASWIPYALAGAWGFIMVASAIQTNPGKPWTEYAIGG